MTDEESIALHNEMEAMLKAQRERAMDAVRQCLPKEQTYVAISIPYIASIKYIDEHGNLSYFGGCGLEPYSMQPYNIGDLPIESLVSLIGQLSPPTESEPTKDSQTLVATEELTIDGESDADGTMEGCDKDEEGFHAPFAIFSPDLQMNVGGPYAKRAHAAAALKLIQQGKMIPYTNEPVMWTVNDVLSKWYAGEPSGD